MVGSTVRFISYPRTEPPPEFAQPVVESFRAVESSIATEHLAKGLTSDKVLQVVRPGLEELGFLVESGKEKTQTIERPVFFGEQGVPTLCYRIDAYHQKWHCGLARVYRLRRQTRAEVA